MVKTLTRNWAWVALRGVAAILFGLLTLASPAVTLALLVLWFGAYALADGALMAVSAVANRRGEPQWAALLVGGLLGIGAGVATLAMPRLTALALLMLVAGWAVVTGVAQLVAAVRLRAEIDGEWLLVLAALTSIGFGVSLFVAPGAGALAMVVWIGAYVLVSGVLLVALGFRLRSWGHERAAGATPHPA